MMNEERTAGRTATTTFARKPRTVEAAAGCDEGQAKEHDLALLETLHADGLHSNHRTIGGKD